MCPISFGRRWDLKKHKESIHEEKRTARLADREMTNVHEKKKPFICEHCKKAFVSKSNLKDHWFSIHRLEAPKILTLHSH